jgi:hypothetical protein
MAEQPGYRVLICEGRRCVPVRDFAGEAWTEAEIVARLGVLAARLRTVGGIGRAVVVDRRSGRVVAARRIWP